jgi:hypothetical protein
MENMELLAGSGSSLLFVVYRFPSLSCDHVTQEGTFTAAFGLATLFFVPASPRTIKLLTEEERETYCRDLADDWSGDADTDGTYEEVFSWSEVASAFTDAPHVLMLFVPLFFDGTAVSCRSISLQPLVNRLLDIWSSQLVFSPSVLSIFTHTLTHLIRSTPTIVNALGHSPNYTQLLTVRSFSTPEGRIYLSYRQQVPPYACSFVFSIVSAYFCDKYKNRSVMATVCALIAAAGYAMFLGASHCWPKNNVWCTNSYSFTQAQTTKTPTMARSIYRSLVVTPPHPASPPGTRITFSHTTAARLPLQLDLLLPIPAASCPLGSSQILHTFRRQVVSTLFSHLGWQRLPWEFLYTSGFAMQRSRRRYSGYCRCTGMALKWVGGTHPQSVSDLETAILASSSQCRPIARIL